MRRDSYLKNVVTLTLDKNRCIGCSMCVNVCPHAVFTVNDRKASILERDACMECGACAVNCPTEAISVVMGVGCAEAIIKGALRGTEPDCGSGCGDSPEGSNCCC